MSEKWSVVSETRNAELKAIADSCFATVLEYAIPEEEDRGETIMFAVYSQGDFVGSFMSYQQAYEVASSFGGRLI